MASPRLATTPSAALSLKDLRLFKPGDKFPNSTLPDGMYFGEIQNDKPQGQGVFISTDGSSRYSGEWDRGMRNGKGVGYTPTYECEGEWELDQPHGNCQVHILKDVSGKYTEAMYSGEMHRAHGRLGRGTMVMKSGESYDGEWCANVRHGKGTQRYVTREIYEGEWKEDERHGQGTMHYLNGDVYAGEWSRGKKDGKGTMKFRHGDVLETTWKDDYQQSQGVMTYKNSDIYDGEWKNSVRHGRGIFFHSKSKSTYEGEFEKGLMHGKGRLQIPGRFIFEGSFAYGERVKGVMSYADGTCYEGEWKADKFHGKGVWWGPDDSAFYYGGYAGGVRSGTGCLVEMSKNIEFCGEFANDVRNGIGLRHDCNTGRIQCGMWKDNEPTVPFYEGDWDAKTFTYHGFGRLTLQNNDRYRGDWQYGKRHGHGEMQLNDGTEYVGEFLLDTMEGHGFMTYASWDTYCGQWKNGKRHGFGVFHDSTMAAVYKGGWENDRPHGDGTLYVNDPSSTCHYGYTGHFQEGCRIGPGVVFYDGCAYRGVWENGVHRISVPNGLTHLDETSTSCAVCNNAFTLFRRKRNCPVCLRALCDSCLNEIPKLNMRSCKTCSEEVQVCCIHGTLFQEKHIYEGFFRKNVFSGPGTMFFLNCDAWYQGEWKNGVRHGYGKLMFGHGYERYVGNWADDRPSGIGIYVREDGVVLEGFWKNGAMEYASYFGECLWRTPSEANLVEEEEIPPPPPPPPRSSPPLTPTLAVPTASPKPGMLSMVSPAAMTKAIFGGFQTVLSAVTPSFSSNTANPQVASARTALSLSSGKEEPMMLRHGLGIAWFTDGKYNGQWKYGKRHGVGVWVPMDGISYHGDWREDKPHGQGISMTGEYVHIGSYEAGVVHGPGSRKYTDRISYGTWTNDVLSGIVSMKFMIASRRFQCGDWYIGIWGDGEERTDAFVPPVLITAEVPSCACCSSNFNLIRRRHNCRGCGQVCCDSCTSLRFTYPAHFKYTGPQRICGTCHTKFTDGLSLGVAHYHDGEKYYGLWCKGSKHGIGMMMQSTTTEDEGNTVVVTKRVEFEFGRLVKESVDVEEVRKTESELMEIVKAMGIPLLPFHPIPDITHIRSHDDIILFEGTTTVPPVPVTKPPMPDPTALPRRPGECPPTVPPPLRRCTPPCPPDPVLATITMPVPPKPSTIQLKTTPWNKWEPGIGSAYFKYPSYGGSVPWVVGGSKVGFPESIGLQHPMQCTADHVECVFHRPKLSLESRNGKLQ